MSQIRSEQIRDKEIKWEDLSDPVRSKIFIPQGYNVDKYYQLPQLEMGCLVWHTKDRRLYLFDGLRLIEVGRGPTTWEFHLWSNGVPRLEGSFWSEGFPYYVR